MAKTTDRRIRIFNPKSEMAELGHQLSERATMAANRMNPVTIPYAAA
jgi:hypothetical protein